MTNCVGGGVGVVLKAGDGITLTGSGTASNPYRMSSAFADVLALRVQDSSSVDLRLLGGGTVDDPYILTAETAGTAEQKLVDLSDVTGTPGNGTVPMWSGDALSGGFIFRPLGTLYVTSTTKPATPWRGQEIRETDTGLWKEWDGAAWAVKAGNTTIINNTTTTTGGGTTTTASMNAGDLIGVLNDGTLPPQLRATASLLSSGTDLNTVQNSGWYRGQALTNAPGSSWFWFQVYKHDSSWVTQVAYDYNSSATYRRTLKSGTWGGWDLQLSVANQDAQLGSKYAKLTNGRIARSATPFGIAAGHQIFNSFTAVNGGYGQTIHVTFPSGRFSSPPEVTATAHTEANSSQLVGAVNVTATGFDLHYWRDSSGSNVWVSWIAMDEG